MENTKEGDGVLEGQMKIDRWWRVMERCHGDKEDIMQVKKEASMMFEMKDVKSKSDD